MKLETEEYIKTKTKNVSTSANIVSWCVDIFYAITKDLRKIANEVKGQGERIGKLEKHFHGAHTGGTEVNIETTPPWYPDPAPSESGIIGSMSEGTAGMLASGINTKFDYYNKPRATAPSPPPGHHLLCECSDHTPEDPAGGAQEEIDRLRNKIFDFNGLLRVLRSVVQSGEPGLNGRGHQFKEATRIEEEAIKLHRIHNEEVAELREAVREAEEAIVLLTGHKMNGISIADCYCGEVAENWLKKHGGEG